MEITDVGSRRTWYLGVTICIRANCIDTIGGKYFYKRKNENIRSYLDRNYCHYISDIHLLPLVLGFVALPMINPWLMGWRAA
jgi:hypothetical protein